MPTTSTTFSLWTFLVENSDNALRGTWVNNTWGNQGWLKCGTSSPWGEQGRDREKGFEKVREMNGKSMIARRCMPASA